VQFSGFGESGDGARRSGLSSRQDPHIGNPGEETLLPATADELDNRHIGLREAMLDGGFKQAPTNTALEGTARISSGASRSAPWPIRDLFQRLEPGRRGAHRRPQEPGSRRTRRHRHRYRTGFEGRVSHLKRGYGVRRSRLKGDEGHRI
jgi:hypothetical protein